MHSFFILKIKTVNFRLKLAVFNSYFLQISYSVVVFYLVLNVVLSSKGVGKIIFGDKGA